MFKRKKTQNPENILQLQSDLNKNRATSLAAPQAGLVKGANSFHVSGSRMTDGGGGLRTRDFSSNRESAMVNKKKISMNKDIVDNISDMEDEHD